MSKILHLGLGKVASSAIQKYVQARFAVANPSSLVVGPFYNEEILYSLQRYLHYNEVDRRLGDFINNQENWFISYEGLLSWDPAYWQFTLNRLDDLVDLSNCEVIILHRNSKRYFDSVYKQAVAVGVTVSEERFFKLKLEKTLPEIYSNISFSKQDYNIGELLTSIKKKSKRVDAFLLEQGGLEAMQVRLGLTVSEIPKVNISYSRVGMILKRAQNRALNLVGFPTYQEMVDFRFKRVSEIKDTRKYRLLVYRLGQKFRLLDRVLKF